jgi:hypothetical protein
MELDGLPMRSASIMAVLVLGFVTIALALTAALPASHAVVHLPPAQPTPFLTPTPDQDGNIIYIVMPGDSLWDIAAIAGIPVQELMALNGIQEADIGNLSVGMRLLLGTASRIVPTTQPDLFGTATPVPATPTPVFGVGEICVLLFHDENGNARLDEDELPLAGGQINIADVTGAIAVEFTSDEDVEYAFDGTPLGHCTLDLEDGDYNISVGVPEDYNPTTAMSIPIRLEPGDIKYVEFGAQPSSAITGDPALDEKNQSLLLGILGVLMLVGAGVLGYQATRLSKRSPESFS